MTKKATQISEVARQIIFKLRKIGRPKIGICSRAELMPQNE